MMSSKTINATNATNTTISSGKRIAILCSRCRRVSRLLLILSVLLLALLQVMTFFVALNGGYLTSRALIMAIVPALGPLFCAFQLLLAGTGAPLVLVLIFAPSALALWASLTVREHCTCEGEEMPFLPVSDFTPTPIDTFRVRVPQPVIETAAATTESTIPVAASVKEPVIVAAASSRPSASTAPDAPMPSAVTAPVPAPAAAPERRTGNEEYDRALQDVLSILNKK